MKLFFILGNQLFPTKYLDRFKKDHLFFMAEDKGLCTYEKHHKQKILLFLSSMRSYADGLRKNKFKLDYFKIEDKEFNEDYLKKLKKIISQKKVKEISSFEVEDKFFEKKILLDCGVIETGKDKKEEDRLYEIFKDLNELINHWNPTAAAVEKFFFYRSSTTISVVQARGVIMMVLASKKIHVSEYSPAQIKLTIAGSGRASKKEVLDAVMYNLDLKKPPKPDDSADALAIALTKLNEDGFN